INPKASLKSLKVKVRAIASRPGPSSQPGNPLRADFRASADSRSAMTASVSDPLYPNTEPAPGVPATMQRQSRSKAIPRRAGNHDAEVTPCGREICYNGGDNRVAI